MSVVGRCPSSQRLRALLMAHPTTCSLQLRPQERWDHNQRMSFKATVPQDIEQESHTGGGFLQPQQMYVATTRRYARGLRKQSVEALVASRLRDGEFRSAEDLAQRVPSLHRKELTLLARIGALNQLGGIEHRRDALWQVERAGKLEGPLFQRNVASLQDDSESKPLQPMNTEERLVADYAGTGLTVGKHPMHYRRAELKQQRVLSAKELRERIDGEYVRTAGCIIARQRPGTAKGFIFLSMEDETGIANVIITPDLYERERLLVTRSKFLIVEGPLQNQDGVIHVKATRLLAFFAGTLAPRSHDFH